MELSQKQRILTLSVRNHGDRPIAFQAETRRWTQNPDGSPHYAPSPELVVVPPLFKVPPGQVRTLRVGLRVSFPKTREQAYRVYVTELPDNQSLTANKNVVSVRGRMGVAVYIQPQQPDPQPRIQVAAFQRQGQSVSLTLENQGNRRDTVQRIELLRGQSVLASMEGTWHLLAGARLQASLPVAVAAARSATQIRLIGAQVSAGPYPLP